MRKSLLAVKRRGTGYRTIAALLAALLLMLTLSSCSKPDPSTDPGLTGEGHTLPGGSSSPDEPTSPNVAVTGEEMFTDRDMDTSYKDPNYVEIKLSDSGTIAESANVEVDGSTITILAEGTYVLSGSLSDGQVIVDVPDTAKVQLVLSGATINRDASAAVYVRTADKVFITLEDGTTNTLSSAGEFAAIDDNNIDSAVFSKEDLTFNGSGSLKVSSEFGHGIVSKDDLVFTGGTYDITAPSHGIQGKDSVRIGGGDFAIVSGKDGIHAENTDDATLGFIYVSGGTFDITAETDGLDAAAYLQVKAGTFALATGGGSENASTDGEGNGIPGWGQWGRNPGQRPGQAPGQGQGSGTSTSTAETATSSAKGLKADGDLLIEAGTFVIDSSDDSLHSNSNIYVSGGSLTLSSGDDGMHADTKVVVSGGSINIAKSFEGIEGQSIDIEDGIVTVVARDDGLNAAGGNDGSGLGGRPGMGNFNAGADCYIEISGGTLLINADGDGVDSNGDLYVFGGETHVSGPTNAANGALDYAGTAKITGGIFIATGSSGMAQNFGNASTQGSILYSTTSAQSGLVKLKDQAGNVIVSCEPEKQYNSVVISAPGIKQGATYTLEMGATTHSITMSSLIYGSGMGVGPGRTR